MPADRREFILQVLGQEGYVARLYEEAREGTDPGTELWIAELEYEELQED